MRYFPSAPRQRLTAACLAVVSLAAFALPLAHADTEHQLKHKQKQVKGQIAHASADLEEASHEVTRANARLHTALGRLGTARRHLADVRRRLGEARTKDAELQKALAAAEKDLETATAALDTATAAVDRQRETVRGTAVSLYTDGDPRLRALGQLLGSGSLQEVAARESGTEVVSGRQRSVFADLETVEAALATQEAKVAATKDDVESKRVAAAEHLEEVQALYTESVAAEKQVQGYVRESRRAREAAYRARAHDRKVLAQLKAREDHIRRQLIDLARKHRNDKGYVGRSDGYLSYPARGPVTSPYGYRIHPIYGYWGLHNGTDFGTGCGAPLYAAAGGTVIDTYYDAVYGNRLYLDLGKINGHNLVLIYNHMSAYRAHEGQKLERGSVVGLSGETGWATGCHLHFIVMQDGVAVDPMKYL